MEKEVFLDKLKKLVALGKSKQNALDATEINDFFAGDNLGPEQMDEIYNYLEHSNIDVVPVKLRRRAAEFIDRIEEAVDNQTINHRFDQLKKFSKSGSRQLIHKIRPFQQSDHQVFFFMKMIS